MGVTGDGFRSFLKPSTPRGGQLELFLILDNYGTHNRKPGDSRGRLSPRALTRSCAKNVRRCSTANSPEGDTIDSGGSCRANREAQSWSSTEPKRKCGLALALTARKR